MRFKTGAALLDDEADGGRVSSWFDELFEQGFNFHPDTAGEEYVHDDEDGELVPSLTKMGVLEYDVLMEAADLVCDEAGEDIYHLGCMAFERWEKKVGGR